jgi:hypothetical protein
LTLRNSPGSSHIAQTAPDIADATVWWPAVTMTIR